VDAKGSAATSYRTLIVPLSYPRTPSDAAARAAALVKHTHTHHPLRRDSK